MPHLGDGDRLRALLIARLQASVRRRCAGFVVLFWIALGIAALALPIVGAIQASQGDYSRYPIVRLPQG